MYLRLLVRWLITRRDRREDRTIAVNPGAGDKVLDVSCVVTTTQSTHVVVDGNQIVDSTLSVGGSFHSVAQIQSLEREVDDSVDFVSIQSTTELAKPLELHDQNIRGSPQLKFLGGRDVGFALRTEPAICRGKNLLLAELVQAFVERIGRFFHLFLGRHKTVIEHIFDVQVRETTAELFRVTCFVTEKGISGIGSPIKQDSIALAEEGMP